MLGPVFHWELVRTSRRSARWILRAAYVAVLVGLLVMTGRDLVMASRPGLETTAIPEAAARFHKIFSISQLLAVLLLAPISAAGSMLEERSGRTLTILLTSCVTDGELVTGKLCLAVLRVGEVVLCGLPFSAFCVLLGGVRPETVFIELLLVIAATFASCAMALSVAVWCRRLVDSLILIYLVQGLWYSLPAFNFVAMLTARQPFVPDAILRLNALRATSEAWALVTGLGCDVWAPSVAALLICGTVFWLGAILSMRRAVNWLEFGGVHELSHSAGRRWPRFKISGVGRPVWDRPVLWRELRSRRTNWVERLVWIVYLVAGLAVLGWMAQEWRAGRAVVQNRTAGGPPPRICILAGSVTFCYLAFLAFPFLAVAGATAFVEEHESELGELLRLTDLRHAELVNAKLVRVALLLLIMIAPPLLLTGVLVSIGYTTWTGLLLLTANCLASFTFASLTGLAIGLRFRKTAHALGATMAFGLLGGFFVPLLSIFSATNAPTPTQFALAAMSPPLQCFFLMMADIVGASTTPFPTISLGAMRAVAVAWTLAYALASLALYVLSLRSAVRESRR